MATEKSAPDHLVGSSDVPLHFPEKDELRNTKSMAEVIRNARNATEKEHKMTLWQGIKLYPKAVFWSVLISTCIAMEGYVDAISNAIKKFKKGGQPS